ncbi:MAG TPA: hypothetical protein VL443_30055 [Cyclobacteriaceae bacterium]|jgi:hypothetical protein|nr:hypothetical protein [Cyclobacteriaceae bacterium]
MKLSDLKRAREQRPTEHTETESKWEVVEYFFLAIIFLTGLSVIVTYLAKVAMEERYEILAGLILIIGSVFFVAIKKIRQ